ncbi:MAG: hypothetical protein PVI52_07505, partial [Chromatiales bacterium]
GPGESLQHTSPQKQADQDKYPLHLLASYKVMTTANLKHGDFLPAPLSLRVCSDSSVTSIYFSRQIQSVRLNGSKHRH